jgi:hypothetical protein
MQRIDLKIISLMGKVTIFIVWQTTSWNDRQTYTLRLFLLRLAAVVYIYVKFFDLNNKNEANYKLPKCCCCVQLYSHTESS